MEESKKIKALPRDDAGHITDFIANGQKYYVMKADDPVGIKRWSVYEKLRLSLGVGRSFGDLVEVLENIELTLAGEGSLAIQRRDAILLLNSLRKSITENSSERYHLAFYICTLFMVKPGEDLSDWNEREADEKISDWEKEGFAVDDFFFFALAGVQGFKAAFTKIRNELAQQEAELLGFSKHGKTETHSG